MGVIDDTGFSIIIKYLRLSVELAGSVPFDRSQGHVRSQFVLSNFPLANRNLPAIISCSSPGPGWRATTRVDASVSAVGYRAFVFAASPYFVAGNRSTECRGAVSVGVVSPARGDASNNFLPSFVRMPRFRISGIECPVHQGRPASDGRIIL